LTTTIKEKNLIDKNTRQLIVIVIKEKIPKYFFSIKKLLL